MADKYGVEVVPTLLFFENGAISKRLEGVIRRASLGGILGRITPPFFGKQGEKSIG
ncbi:MAG: thioredoxin family protein [Proteobacteria bacterium]|nr:thioredoxin family protein [Pseudomonadota bacterium]